MIKQINLLLVLLICLSKSLFAQCNLSIEGRVIDEHDQVALEAASIEIVELNRASISQSDGSYQINNLCKGTYTLICSHLGCTPIKLKIHLEADTVINFYPEHHVHLLQEVELLYSDTLLSYSLDKQIGTVALQQSTTELLEALPNTRSLSTGSQIQIPVLQGLHTVRLAIVSDFTKLESQQWGIEHAPEIAGNSFASTEVVQGSERLYFDAEAAGGILRLKSQPFVFNEPTSSLLALGLSSNGRGFYTSFKHRRSFKGDWHPVMELNLYGSKNGNLKSPDYFQANTGGSLVSASAKLQLQAGKWLHQAGISGFFQEQGIFAGAHIGNLTDLSAAIAVDTPLVHAGFTYQFKAPYQSVDHISATWKSSRYLGQEGKLTAAYSYQRNLRKEYDENTSPFLSLSLQSHAVQFRLDQDKPQHTNVAALLGEIQQSTYDGSFFIPNYQKVAAGVFLSRKQKFANACLDLGLRLDARYQTAYFFDATNLRTPEKSKLAPAFSMTWEKKGTKHALNISLSSTWRLPDLNELYANGLHHGAASIERGNGDLNSERSYQLEGSYSRKVDENWQFQASPFLRYMPNFIYLQLAASPVLTIRGAFPAYDYLQAEAFFAGVDMGITRQLDIMSLSVQYAMVYARNLSTDSYFPQLPSDQLNFTLESEDVEWKLGQLKGAFELNTVFKQNRFERALDYMDSPGTYHLVNLNLQNQFKNQTYGLRVENLSNGRYRSYMNRFRYFTDEPGINFRIFFKINLS